MKRTTTTTRALQYRPFALFHRGHSSFHACFDSCRQPKAAAWETKTRRQKMTTTTATKENNFHRVPDETPIEEELLPGYKAEDYYPVVIGLTLVSRYRIICKLGRGVGSTVWLAKDLKTSHYQAVKVCTRTPPAGRNVVPTTQASQELAVASYLNTADARVRDHPGKSSIRTVLDSFTINGPHGEHTCLVYSPQGMTFTELRDYMPNNKLGKRMLQASIQVLLIAMDYLHKNGVVHTDISPNNILLGATVDTPFRELEEDEEARPIARKVLSDRTIYMSRPVPRTDGELVLSDMGSARFGHEAYEGDVMPDVYRAPEVILGMEWSSKVDLWSVGVMIWDLLEGNRLFNAKKDDDGALYDEQHLAEMVSLMGKPPPEFLQRSKQCARYFDVDGNWIGSVPIPDQSFESRITQVEGEDKELLLGFVRRLLCWLPEQRPTAEDMAYDDFLMQAYFAAQSQD